MPYMVWDGSLSIGHEAIDADHRMLVNCVNDVYDASGDTEAVVERVIGVLTQYTIEHFGREEELMQRFNYPNIRSHEEEHYIIRKLLEGHQLKYSSDENGIENFLHFLKLWLVGHIKGSDLKLAEYLRKANPVY